MSIEDLSARLVELGVGADEARTYVQLNGLGPSTASIMASRLRVSRPRAYRLLESLASDGFVTSGVGRPRLFQTIPPAIVLDALQFRARELLTRLDAARLELMPRLEGLRHGGTENAEQHFTVIRGLNPLGGQAGDVAASAHSKLAVLLSTTSGPHILRTFVHARIMQERAKHGCTVRLLLAYSGESMPATPLPELAGVEVRVARAETVCTFILCDGREGLTLVASDMPQKSGASGALGFRTNAQHFVAMQQTLFELLWESAQPVGKAVGRKGIEKVSAIARSRAVNP